VLWCLLTAALQDFLSFALSSLWLCEISSVLSFDDNGFQTRPHLFKQSERKRGRERKKRLGRQTIIASVNVRYKQHASSIMSATSRSLLPFNRIQLSDWIV